MLTITCQQVSSSSSLKITLITWKDEGQSASTVSSYKDARMNICRDLPRSSRLFNTVTRPMASLHCFTLNKNGNLFDIIGFLISTSPVLPGFCTVYSSVYFCTGCWRNVYGIMITSNVLAKMMPRKIIRKKISIRQ